MLNITMQKKSASWLVKNINVWKKMRMHVGRKIRGSHHIIMCIGKIPSTIVVIEIITWVNSVRSRCY